MGDVALSFDNGPDPAVTPVVLDVLARRGVKASFFVLGKCLASPERMKLAERAAAEGHRIGNHSYTHRIPLGDDPKADAVDLEIAKTERLIGALADGGHRMTQDFPAECVPIERGEIVRDISGITRER